MLKLRSIQQYNTIKNSVDRYDLFNEAGEVCTHLCYLDDAKMEERCQCI